MVNKSDNMTSEADRLDDSVCGRISISRWSGLGGGVMMFKFHRLLCAVLVCALVGVAYGAARKIKSFTTFNEPAGADGMAILNIHDGTGQEVQLLVTDFTPDSNYVVHLFHPDFPTNQPEVGIFTTNEVGNGHWHGDIGTLFPWPCLLIYSTVGDQLGEVRAQGCVGS